MELKFDDIIREAAPELEVITLEAEVTNSPSDSGLWEVIDSAASRLRTELPLGEINRRPGIKATRDAYKRLGKEPNRYRPSAEALCRRIVKGMELYRVDTLVDLINLLSFTSGYSIGGFDADRIDGDTLTLGAGREGEDFDAIGRGKLNIACMPVYRDLTGGVGTPTSDNERTKLSLDTHRLLMVVNIYGHETDPDIFIDEATGLLRTYAAAGEITIKRYRP